MRTDVDERARGAVVLVAVAAIAAAGCGAERRPATQEELDRVRRRAGLMLANSPSAGSLPKCAEGKAAPGLIPMTHNSLLRLAGKPVADDPEHAAWLNPPSIDGPAARTLVDAGDDLAKVGPAAAAWLAAPGYLIHRIDNVDAPLALGIKELKRGTVSARQIRYASDGRAECFRLLLWQNTKERSDWAIARSDRAVVAPEVVAAMREDLAAGYLRKLAE